MRACPSPPPIIVDKRAYVANPQLRQLVEQNSTPVTLKHNREAPSPCNDEGSSAQLSSKTPDQSAPTHLKKVKRRVMLDNKAKGRITEMIKEEILRRSLAEEQRKRAAYERAAEDERFSHSSFVQGPVLPQLHLPQAKTISGAGNGAPSPRMQQMEHSALNGLGERLLKRASPMPDTGAGLLAIGRDRKRNKKPESYRTLEEKTFTEKRSVFEMLTANSVTRLQVER